MSTPSTPSGDLPPGFEFATAARIVFGVGALSQVGSLARGLGSRALILTGKSALRAATLAQSLEASEVVHRCFALEGEPSVDEVVAATRVARDSHCDLVIGCGGGSAMDAAKAAKLVAEGESVHLVAGSDNRARVLPEDLLALIQGT